MDNGYMKDNGYWPAIRDSQLWKLKQSSICKSYFLRLVVHKSAHHYFDGKSKEFRESGLLRVHFHLVSRGILVCVCLGVAWASVYREIAVCLPGNYILAFLCMGSPQTRSSNPSALRSSVCGHVSVIIMRL